MPQMGSEFVIEVEDPNAPGSFVPIHGMNSYNRTPNRDRTTYPVFMRATPYSLVGPRETTYTLAGYLDMADPGQNILRAAEAADDIVTIRVLPDGTNGFTQPIQVGTVSHDADPEAFQEYSFEMTATDDPTIIGAGPVV